MIGLLFGIICRVYLLALLLATTLMSPLPYSPVALILLLGVFFGTLRPLPARLSIVTAMTAIFILPLLLEPLLENLAGTGLLSSTPLVLGGFDFTTIQIMAVAAALPTVYLLNRGLRQDAPGMVMAHGLREGKYITTTTITLFASTLIILLASAMISDITLFLAALIPLLYLLVLLMYVLLAVPKLPADIPVTDKRVIAGETVDIYFKPESRASIRLYSIINPTAPEIIVRPRRFTLDKAGIELRLTITPPLAGPSRPQLRLSAIDPWGLFRVNQAIEPVELHVIPRARYAEWLAMRYLEETQARGAVATTTPEASMLPKRGVEYFSSRDYQPGDELRYIDWKHTLKFKRLVIKEYIAAGQQSAIVGVNLSVSDIEEADKLAFNLITTSLTLAQEAIPTALAVYNHQEVVLVTPFISPREIVKKALALIREINCVEFAHRFLQPADIGQIRRNIVLLKQTSSQPAQQLCNILNFERRAIEEDAKGNPATLALSKVAKYAPSPVIIALVTQLNHDTEALMITKEILSRRGFTFVSVEATRQPGVALHAL